MSKFGLNFDLVVLKLQPNCHQTSTEVLSKFSRNFNQTPTKLRHRISVKLIYLKKMLQHSYKMLRNFMLHRHPRSPNELGQRDSAVLTLGLPVPGVPANACAVVFRVVVHLQGVPVPGAPNKGNNTQSVILADEIE